MPFNISLSSEALLDLSEARTFYENISNDLLKKFDDEIIYTIEKLEENPQYFQKRYRDIKIVFTKTFPFCIHYVVDAKVIYVQRILHQKRFYE